MAKEMTEIDKLLNQLSSKLDGKSNLSSTLDKITKAASKMKEKISAGLLEIKDKGVTADSATETLNKIQTEAKDFSTGVSKTKLVLTRIKTAITKGEKKLKSMGEKNTPARKTLVNKLERLKVVKDSLNTLKDKTMLSKDDIDIAKTDINDKNQLTEDTTTEAYIDDVEVNVQITEGHFAFTIKTGTSKVAVVKHSGKHEDSSIIGSSTLTLKDANGKTSKVKFDSIDTMGQIMEIYEGVPKLKFLDLDLVSGFIAINGKSGSGKSTLTKTITDTYLAQKGIILNGKTNNILLRTAISQLISIDNEDRVVNYGDKHAKKVLYGLHPALKDQEDILDSIALISMNEPESRSAQYGFYSFVSAIFHAISNKKIVLIDSFKEVHTVLHGPAVAKGFTWSMSALLSKINNYALKNDCLVFGVFNPVLNDPVISEVMDQFMKANCEGIINLSRISNEFSIEYYERPKRTTTHHKLTPRGDMAIEVSTEVVPYYKYNRNR